MRSFRAALVLALCLHASVAIAFVCARPAATGTAAHATASAALEEHDVALLGLPTTNRRTVGEGRLD